MSNRTRDWDRLDKCPTCSVPAKAQCVKTSRWASVPRVPKDFPHMSRPLLPPPALPFGTRPRPCGACGTLNYTCRHWPASRRSACCGKARCPEVTAYGSYPTSGGEPGA